MSNLPTIGVMLGDVTGIGPEIAAKVLASGALRDQAQFNRAEASPESGGTRPDHRAFMYQFNNITRRK